MKKSILFFLLCFLSISSYSQIHQPVKWVISCSEIGKEGDAVLTFKSIVDKGWHIYDQDLPEDGPRSTSFNFEKLDNVEIIGKVAANKKAIEKFEPLYQMNLRWYEETTTFTQHIKVTDPNNYEIDGYVEYMVCNDNTCLPPTSEAFHFEKHNKSTVALKPVVIAPNPTVAEKEQNISNTDTTQSQTAFFPMGDLNISTEADWWEPQIETLNKLTEGGNTLTAEEDSLWFVFWIGFLGGLVAIITPCVWPIIPMTVSFFLKNGDDSKKGKKAAITYGLSIIAIYLCLGIFITLLFGADALNALSTNAIFNLFIFALLVLFAISFFGGFDLTLPATWSTKLDNKADKTSGLISILFMALTLVIVSFSCTGPLIGTLLVHVSTEGNILAPTIGMLGFAIALAGPFTLFAFFPSWLKNLPRSGGWLNTVKVLLGFFELAFSLKFLSVADLAYGWHILDREVFIVLWIVIFLMAGLYLLGKIKFKGDDDIDTISVPRIFAAGFCFSFMVYLVPGLFGAPLKAISAFAPPLWTQDLNLYEETQAKFTSYEEGMKYAKEHQKPVLVDFTGYGCVNCREMEAKIWNNPEVSSLLDNDYVLISLYVDDKRKLAEPMIITENGKEKKLRTIGEKWSYLQRHKFGANAQPFYVILNNSGEVINQPIGFTKNSLDFIQFLKKGLNNYQK